MSFTFNIPPYVTANGGQLLIKFLPDDTYTAIDPNTLSYPTSLAVTDSTGSSYVNSISFDTTTPNSPNSIKQITVQLCGTSNPCSGTISIGGLIRGYYPLTTMTQTIEITTQGADSIAVSSFSALQFNPVKRTSPLGISLTNSVTTLKSQYIFTFTSDKVPVEGKIVFDLSSMHNITGGCFGV